MDSVYILIMILLLSFLCCILVVIKAVKKRAQLRRYERIQLGMSESQMLDIMGGGYNKSLLKNDRVKYEWRIGAVSTSSRGSRVYSGVSKVAIYVKNGFVEEVKPYNVR